MPDPTDQPRGVAIAIAAHPDDIEFMMAGRCCCYGTPVG
ncbi:MAG: hypothetical protein Ct9H300mP32_0960 [Verrucomicrobiota bacterium]|nr:MAG: hypothetical protein Ct9H300mP32_0960 [Verrucomicrobiota bacterium]